MNGLNIYLNTTKSIQDFALPCYSFILSTFYDKNIVCYFYYIESNFNTYNQKF